MLHYRKNILISRKMIDDDKNANRPCPFCDISQIVEIVSETKHMRLARNRIGFDVFEGIPVKDHLMVLPKAHRTTLADFTPAESAEYVKLIGKYEKSDYSVYTRSVNSKTRSIAHVHTHLLLMTGKRVRFLFFLDKPYLMFHGPQRKN